MELRAPSQSKKAAGAVPRRSVRSDSTPHRDERDEAGSVRMLLQHQRDSFVRKLGGVDEEAARTSLVPGGTTLLWLATHTADAELLWMLVRFGGADRSV
jgi:hypothetical protein